MIEHSSPYEECLEVCERLDHPGVALGVIHWIDFVGRDTTAEQIRIEELMVQMDLPGRNILHVGVGNARLARRFASLVKLIDDITVSEEEKIFADSLDFQNYTTYVLNKHSRYMLTTLCSRTAHTADKVFTIQ